MLARARKLQHPLGAVVSTPLLVPSFSSKGLKQYHDGPDDGVSELQKVLDVAKEFLTESMLISAYDLHSKHLQPLRHSITEITLLDSGGYETSGLQDLSAPVYELPSGEAWDEKVHQALLDEWPEHVASMFISYDSEQDRLPIAAQIERARGTLSKYRRNQMVTLLLKPEAVGDQVLPVQKIVGLAQELKDFDVIGVTEKEIGRSMLERMRNITSLRVALDRCDVSAPLHVFGSLDPLAVPLFFISGAEIFDGLTWLRYGYEATGAMYRGNFAIRNIDIKRNDEFVRMKTIQDNLGFLSRLSDDLKIFVNDKDFRVFRDNEKVFQSAIDVLRTQVREVL
jgi:hypothetical protein